MKFTIFFVWVLGAHDGASAKHHLVLSEGPVLSEKMYSICPRSSVMSRVLHCTHLSFS